MRQSHQRAWANQRTGHVDAIYVVLGGADSVNFLTQYQQHGGQAPLVGGSVTVDQTILSSKGKIHDVVAWRC
jgi:branched-chain amino acid transport system substrate-binding protein